MNDRIRKKLTRHTPGLLKFFKAQYEQNLTREQMDAALVGMFERFVDEFVEDLDQSLYDPQAKAHQALRDALPKGSVFNGYREFSLEKFSAVLLFFIMRAGVKMMTRTKLNKLAFYSDFYHYKATGRSITGTTYRHLPYGPVVDGYEEVIAYLEQHDVISIETVQTRHGVREVIRAGGKSSIALSDSENKTLDAVASVFGKLSAEEISEISHAERAWKDTRTGEEIAYPYSKFMPELGER